MERTFASSSEGRNSCLAGIGTGNVYLQSRREAVRPAIPSAYDKYLTIVVLEAIKLA